MRPLMLVPGFDILGKRVRHKSGAGGVSGGEGSKGNTVDFVSA